MKHVIKILVVSLFCLAFAGVPQSFGEDRVDCDACPFRIESLDKPFSLTGTWLFTREDSETNAQINIDTSEWKTVNAPGPWKKVYNDGKDYSVGWYRGVLEFNPELIGQEVVFLVDTYMGRINFFLDEQEIYRRPGRINTERYYSVQPVPVRFTVKQIRHTVAIKVDTPLMTGIYQLPLELRKYDQHDVQLAWFQFWGGEVRMIAGYVILFFGFFFLLVYIKTEYGMYLFAAIVGFVGFPFYCFPGDNLLKVFAPEQLLYMHYFGLYSFMFIYIFSQYFYKFTPKFNWFYGGYLGLMACSFIVLAFTHFEAHLKVFQIVRVVYFVSCLVLAFLMVYQLTRGVLLKKPGAGTLLAGTLFFMYAGIHDMLLALGKINATAMIFAGALAATACMLWVSITRFANTFVENKVLLKEVRDMNENLESLVAERTAQLREKTNDIQSMLQNMPEGILTVMEGNEIHHEYSAYLEDILETKEIAGKDVMDVVFKNTNLGADAVSGVDAVFGACIGQDSMNFEFNTHMMAREIEKHFEGHTKSLELSWSPICNDEGEIDKLMLCIRDVTELKQLQAEAAGQKRELEIIGQILAVSQEKFHEFVIGSEKFIEENRKIVNEVKERDPEILSTLFRNMHTIKGNARTYAFVHLTNRLHETEHEYDVLRKDPNAVWDPQHLLQQLDESLEMILEYASINDNKLGRKGPGRRGNVDKFLMIEKDNVENALSMLRAVELDNVSKLKEALADVENMLKLIGTEKIGNIISGVIESVPALAQELDKEAPEIKIVDDNVSIKNQVFGLLRNSFMHIFRNSMDHGVETPKERTATGKAPASTIMLTVSLDEKHLTFRYKDDGRGLAISKIKEKAIANGLISKTDKLSHEEVAQLIFHSGLSTAEKVTEVSGRGVGMDAVKKFFESEHGSVSINVLKGVNPDAEYVPVEFVLTLPANVAVKAKS
ncbi:ATP-binding protein [Deltaproteobacteria bacterium TL4]